ncbi:MAG TPA: hypothetical protein VFR84_15425 [Candidatus Angelobacter sp.]|nr:hypothetical protein [Candidatus Angelobacter sp.]
MPRPVPVAIIAAFLFLATAIAALVGIALLFPGTRLDFLWQLNKPGAALFHSIGRIAGLFLLALGFGTLAAGFGLLRGREWAWWFAVALFAVNSAGDAVSYFVTHDSVRAAAGVFVSLIFLYLLSRGAVRSYFFPQ